MIFKLKSFSLGLVLSLMSLAASADTTGETRFNATGTVTRPANTTAYTGSQLYCAPICVATQIPVTGAALSGTGIMVRVAMLSSNTNSTAPQYTIYFFNKSPTLTGLSDQSIYIGPYAADWTGGGYIGAFTCSSFAKTNDSTYEWASECAGSNLNLSNSLPFQAVAGQNYVYAVVEVTGSGYTPLSGEKLSIFVSGLLDVGG